MSLTFIDLFCGAGGFSEGLRQAGHECILAVDSWDTALETHKINHPDAEHWCRDVMEIDRDELPNADILIGSPPCQGFSQVNLHRDKEPDTTLIEKFLELAENYDIFVGENVPGVRKLLKIYISKDIKIQVLNASDFGMYHRRTRIFFGKFPRVKKITRNKAYFPTPRAANKNGTKQMAINITANRRKRKKGKSLYDFQLAYPWYVSRWIMGFPENYIFTGTDRQKEKQIGNAVCPPVAKAIGEAIKNRKK